MATEVAMAMIVEQQGRDPAEVASRLVAAHRGQPEWLDAFAAEFERHRAGAALGRTLRIWGLSRTEAGEMFGISRQALTKWLEHGVPSDRAEQVANLSRVTDHLVRHLKQDRIPAVVRTPAPGLGDRTVMQVFAEDGGRAALEVVRAMFAFSDAHA